MTNQWWRDAVVYQIYPRSFADSDGDGLGDLPGITAKLDHLVALGVDAFWLSPFYVSPQADAGYDVADYRDVDPIFGRLTDVDTLVSVAHAHGLRVIIDLVPNHTSSAHVWFQAALAAAPGSPERARYLFRDGRGPGGNEPPNNWQSIFGGPAWTRVPDGQWYLHLFDSAQPDLDWDSPAVRDEFDSVLRFWFDRGVDGVRIDVAHGMVKAPGLPDAGVATAWAEPDAGPMWDQDGVHEIFRRWRKIAESYPDERILVAEAWVSPLERLARYLRPDELHQAFNFEYLLTPWRAADQRTAIAGSLAAADSVGAPSTWVLSNHDVIRHPTRLAFGPEVALPPGLGPDEAPDDPALGLRRARAATLLMLALPGSAYLYQGEELGLPEDAWLPDEARQDPQWRRTGGAIRGRDGCRVPLPWVADAPSYGFGPGPESWLPQPAVWAEYALDRQRGVAGSTYELYREALALRRRLGLGVGTLAWLDFGPDVIALDNGTTLVVSNLGTSPVPLPPGTSRLLASGPMPDAAVPPDTTVWATRTG